MKRILFFTLLQILFIGAVIGQDGVFKLSGKVVNKSGESLPGAAVVIKQNSLGCSTNANGEFIFNKLPKHKYTLLISFLGYQTNSIEVNLIKDEFVKVVLTESTILVDEVIVKATRAGINSPVAYKNIKAADIKSVNVGQDLPVLLDLTPSVVTTSDAGAGVGYTGIRVRGSDATRVNVTINGIPVNDAESHGVWWVNMPDITSSVKDIQIQRGVGTSTNGAGAFGATINLQTESVSKNPYAEVGVSGGSFNTHKETVKFSTGLMDNNIEFTGRLSNIMSDGYIDRAESDLKSYFLSATYATEKTLIKLLGFGGKEKTYMAWDGIDKATLESDRTCNYSGAIYNADGSISYYDNQTDNYQQHHTQLLASHQLTKEITANIGLHYTRGKGYYQQYNQDEDFSKIGLAPINIGGVNIDSTDAITQKWLDNHFYGSTFGLNYAKNNLNITLGGAYNNYNGDHYGQIIWARYASNSENDKHYYDNTGTKSDFNTFVKANYKFGKLSVFGDLQYRNVDYKVEGLGKKGENYNLHESWGFLNPKVGLSFSINPDQSIYASYSVAHREPNRGDFLDSETGKPKAEMLQDVEAGYRLFGEKLALNINYYYMYYTDQLVLTGKVNDVGSPIRSNVGASFRTGVEIIANYKPFKFVEWQPNFAYGIHKNVDYVLENSDKSLTQMGNTDIAYSPSIIAGSNLSFYPIKKLTLALQNKYVGEQFMTNYEFSDSKLDAYFTTNINISYTLNNIKIFKSVDFNLLVNNIFNTKYVSNGYMWDIYPYYFPQAGINFLAGVNIKF
ncbi:MAG: TonB-dependent receptor [Bacteroidales bacterium]|nr:TonB-dependent receptor [Bacteroidales bacterium]